MNTTTKRKIKQAQDNELCATLMKSWRKKLELC